jgi:RNA polymerase sigma factor (sigma-70 family)
MAMIAWHISTITRLHAAIMRLAALRGSDPTAQPERLSAGIVRGGVSSDKQERFEAFFWQHEHAIVGYLWHMVGDEQTAHDLAQETFLRAWQHFDAVATYDNPTGWLYRVATNLALNLRRRRTSPVGRASSLDDEPEPARSDPTGHIVERELVRRILQDLPPRQRTTLILSEMYDFKRAEIAGILGISLEAVHMALWRAHATFRSRYLEEMQRA